MKNFQQKSLSDQQEKSKFQAALVTEYMVRNLITFTSETPITEVIESLLSNRITGAPVLNSKKEVVGLIDDKDCLKVLAESAYHNVPVSQNKVQQYMSNVMKSISDKDNIVDVANIFLTTKYKRLLVMDDDGKLVGQISRRDILRAIKDLKL